MKNKTSKTQPVKFMNGQIRIKSKSGKLFTGNILAHFTKPKLGHTIIVTNLKHFKPDW